eukprot:4090453-Pleurochrysis_carterae.AAC.2
MLPITSVSREIVPLQPHPRRNSHPDFTFSAAHLDRCVREMTHTQISRWARVVVAPHDSAHFATP